MAHDIMISNRDNVLHWIDRFQEELSRFRAAIAAGETLPVLEAFARPQLERDNYMVNGAPRRDAGEPIETISLGDMLLGSKISGMMKKQQEILKAAEERAEKKR